MISQTDTETETAIAASDEQNALASNTVVCAHRDPSNWTTRSNVNVDPEGNASSDSHTPTLAHAQPYIDAGCISFIELSAEEATMSSSEVRKRIRGETTLGDGQDEDERGWRRMVPGVVAKYVQEAGLYTSSG